MKEGVVVEIVNFEEGGEVEEVEVDLVPNCCFGVKELILVKMLINFL